MAYNPLNPNGQATSTNSSPVVLASDQVSTATGDAGQNALVHVGARSEQTFSVTTVSATTSKDVSSFKSVSIQITSQGTGSTVTFQGSNDNTTWLPVIMHSVALSSTGGGLGNEYLSTTGTGIFYGSTTYRYFRLNVTGISAGTTAGVIEYFSNPLQFTLPTIVAIQNGTWNVGLSAGTNTVGSFVQAPLATSTGLTSFQNTAVAATAVTVKASAGRLHRITIQNPNTSIAWLQVFNATAPTVGTTTPVMSIPIPASGIFEDFYPMSDTFGTAITIAATTTPTGSTANTTALFVSLGYI